MNINDLHYTDIMDLEDSPDPEDQELVRLYWRQQQDILIAHENLQRERDREWESWIQRPEAVFDCIRDPELAQRPSERPSPLERI